MGALTGFILVALFVSVCLWIVGIVFRPKISFIPILLSVIGSGLVGLLVDLITPYSGVFAFPLLFLPTIALLYFLKYFTREDIFPKLLILVIFSWILQFLGVISLFMKFS